MPRRVSALAARLPAKYALPVMRTRTCSAVLCSVVVVLAGWLAGCGDDDVVPGSDAGVVADAAAGDSGIRDAGAAPADAGDPLDAGGLDAGTGADAGAGFDAGASLDAAVATDAGPPRDATTSAVVTITDFFAWSNCMPIVAPDPVIATWMLHVTGATGTTATVVDAKLTIAAPSTTLMQTITLDTPAVTLTGGAGAASQRKASGTPGPTGACSSLCAAGTTSHLELTVEVDGVRIVITADDGYSCPL